MDLTLGSRLGPYEIVAELARGGMGQVYRGRDPRLGRDVAIKVLPLGAVQDEVALARFEQEARAVAALSHPNVLAIYDLGEEAGRRYIVTELLSGSSLRQRLREEPLLNVGEIVGIAIQIADGLAAAHGRAIIHRDLKPENIFLTDDGLVKILDFGVARFDAPVAPPTAAGDETDAGGRREAKSASSVHTQTGMVLGTVGYMSPEQVKSRPLDSRSDLFALGCLFYEMLTLRRAFDGPSPVEAMMSILSEEPGPMVTQPPVPLRLEAIVRALLRKNPDERLSSARELSDQLRALSASLDSPTRISTLVPSAVTPVPAIGLSLSGVRVGEATDRTTAALGGPLRARLRARRRLLVGLAATAWMIVLAGGAAWLWKNRQATTDLPAAASQPSAAPVQLTTGAGLDAFPSFSPDGKWVAYATDRSGSFEIVARPLEPGGQEIAITSDGEDNVQPAFSPDGERVVYVSRGRGGLWVVPAFGGTPRQLSPFGSRPAWSPDGARIAWQSAPLVDLAANALGDLPPSAIWVAAADGSGARAVTRSGTPDGGHNRPAWTPDGRRLVFSAYDRQTSDLWSVPAQGGAPVRLVTGERFAVEPAVAPDGKTLYFAQVSDQWTEGLWGVDLADGGARVAGEARPLATPGPASIRHLAVSKDGRHLAFATMAMSSNLWELPLRPGKGEAAGEPRPLTMETGRSSRPAVSPDGRSVAFDRWRSGAAQDLWWIPAAGQAAQQLTTAPGNDSMPQWLPGGRLAFVSEREGKPRLWVLDVATGREKILLDLPQHFDFPRLSPDGTLVAFNSKKGSGTFSIWVAPVDGSAPPRQLAADPELIGFACWAPDGKTLVAERKRGANTEVVRLSLDGGREPEAITRLPGQAWPHSFSPDGRWVAFAGHRDGFWNVWAVGRDGGTERPLTRLRRLGAYVRFPDWSPSGDRLIYELAETRGNIWMLDLPESR